MKGIQEALEEVSRIHYFAVPAEYGPLPKQIASSVVRTPTGLYVRCSHLFHSPATETELEVLETDLGQAVPLQLIELLKITNGAELFRIRYEIQHEYWVPRYDILNCERMVQVNKGLYEKFQSYAEFDVKYQGRVEQLRLDYLAFCDVGDGNFLAFHLAASTMHPPIFYLNHDYGAYPYSDDFAREGYPHRANSLLEWLEQLIRSRGQEGTGGQFIPF